MATFSSEELARKVLALYVEGTVWQVGRVINCRDLLWRWPKGFSRVEMDSGLEYASRQGWLEPTDQGFKLTPSGLAQAQA